MPTLVLGACGGAGATTTALGLANTAAVRGGAVVTVDATPAGGDIAERGADAVLSVSRLEQVVAAGPVADDVFDGYCSRTSAGTRILNRIGNSTAVSSEFHTLAASLRDRQVSAVHDLGHRLRAAYLAPLLATPSPIVLVVPCRADAFNRLRAALQSIGDTLGEPGLARTVVTVSNQDATGWQVDVDLLRGYLGGQVWGIETIPYDEHLGMGIVIDHARLAPQTRAAYERVSAAASAVAEGRPERV
jgi:MinD-like ATPase involved in chromosome partitioning or flagellar assembly